MKKKISIIRFLPFILWAILIFILLTLPARDFNRNLTSIPHLDKLVHMGLFGGFVFWFGFALLHNGNKNAKISIHLITIASCIYGVLMEYVQKYFTHNQRGFSYLDMVADVIGAILAFALISWILKKYQIIKTKRQNN